MIAEGDSVAYRVPILGEERTRHNRCCSLPTVTAKEGRHFRRKTIPPFSSAPPLYYSARVCLFSPPWKQHNDVLYAQPHTSRVSLVPNPIRATTSKPWHQRVHQRRSVTETKKARRSIALFALRKNFRSACSWSAASSEPTGSVRR